MSMRIVVAQAVRFCVAIDLVFLLRHFPPMLLVLVTLRRLSSSSSTSKSANSQIDHVALEKISRETQRLRRTRKRVAGVGDLAGAQVRWANMGK